jgi:hypothetical protein
MMKIGQKAFYDLTGMRSIEHHTDHMTDWLNGLEAPKNITFLNVETLPDRANPQDDSLIGFRVCYREAV